MHPDELTGADRAILDVLKRTGNATQAYISDETEYSRQQIHSRLGMLRVAGHVERIHEPSALYALKSDPRDALEDDGDPDGDGSDTDDSTGS